MSKKPSGSEYRKRARERNERESALLNKIHRLDDFFNKPETPSCSAETLPVVTGTERNVVSEDSGVIVEVEVIQQPASATATDVSDTTTEIAPVHVPSPPSTEQIADVGHQLQDCVPANKEVTDSKNLDDPALWLVNEALREYFAVHSINQNDSGDFSQSKRQYSDQNRYLNKACFFKKLVNGEIVKRTHLVYSKSTGYVYCAPCKLYGGTTALATCGFNDWKNSHKIQEHDNSLEHRECVNKYLTRMNAHQRIDAKLLEQHQVEVKYWRDVLSRVVEVVKYLTSRGLPFYGENEILGSTSNGNFLGCIELLCKFDPFMADHVARFGNKGKGVPSYLSSTIVNEFITLLADNVKSKIASDIKNSKYFSIIVDSTPDVSNVDQLTFVIRFVAPDGSPNERFITFIPNCGHKGEDMEKAVINTLESLNLNISDCRGQSYDNASNMSGCYKGLQNRIKEQNPLAHYVPCAAHSLQLVGSTAAESSSSSVEYFALAQQMYNFFHSSTHRWEILLSQYDKECLTVKTLSKTRWSARADASKAMHKSYKQIIAALQDITSNEENKKDVRLEAKQLIEKLQSLEMTMMICFWNKVLMKFHDISVRLQSEDGDLDQTSLSYELLESFLSSLRNEEQFSNFESEAKLMCNSQEYKQDNTRKKKPKIPFGESKEGHTEFDGRKSFLINCYYKAIDTLLGQLTRRKSIYVTLRDSFNFLWNLNKIESSILKEKATKLMNEYSTDLDDSFPDECLYLQKFLKDDNTFYEEENVLSDRMEEKKKVKPTGTKAYRLLKHVKTLKLESLFPNVEVALRIFLSMAVSNCSGERSFSALTRVKNYLRSTLRQEKLQALALLFIESDYVQLVPFDDLIDAFASSKARKKDFV